MTAGATVDEMRGEGAQSPGEAVTDLQSLAVGSGPSMSSAVPWSLKLSFCDGKGSIEKG